MFSSALDSATKFGNKQRTYVNKGEKGEKGEKDDDGDNGDNGHWLIFINYETVFFVVFAPSTMGVGHSRENKGQDDHGTLCRLGRQSRCPPVNDSW